jgi:hypothetical protein
MKAPWIPPKGDNCQGKKNDFSKEDEALMIDSESVIRRDSVQELFEGYYYDIKNNLGQFKDEDTLLPPLSKSSSPTN